MTAGARTKPADCEGPTRPVNATMRIDLTTTPFSRRGCWMNLAKPQLAAYQPLGRGLYLRTNHHRPLARRELFKIELLRGGKSVPFRSRAGATELILEPKKGTGRVVMVFENDTTLRVRGEGVELAFVAAIPKKHDPNNAAHFVAYQDGPDRYTVNCRPSMHRYQFEALAGQVELDAPFDRELSTRADVHCRPGADGCWEVAIDEYVSTWTPRKRPTFAVAHRATIRAWRRFRDQVPALAETYDEARELAAYVMWSCIQAPHGQLAREAMFMSLNWMDQVWSWDNCFNAAACALIDSKLARDQFLVVYDHQDEFGAFPDGVNDGFKHYCFSKPPVQGLIYRWIADHSPSFWTTATQRALYPASAKFTDWWLTHRRWPGKDLCHYLHGNDSGWDNTTLLRKGAPLIAPDLNAFLISQCRMLAEMAPKVGRKKDVDHWLAEADRLQEALITELWNGKQFVGQLVHTGQSVKSRSLVGCMPIVLGQALPEDIRTALIKRIGKFVTKAGLATEMPDSPLYEPDGYWRGPMWAPSTMLTVIGLEAAGDIDLARAIAQRFCATCVKSGFAENFDALTGAPLRDKAYTWTPSAFLELARVYG